ncbi:hypothetical protein [Glycomyces sp. YM15]|uniref:hypothetical protein n=1 Tax=Glycomyces sp. YM15 TaxID=2800446 RepID=UPI0019649A3F|nr:hypothetical protein [Glycomyces sp. YM15]
MTAHQVYVINPNPQFPVTTTSVDGGPYMARASVARLIGMGTDTPDLTHFPGGVAAWHAPAGDTADLAPNPVAALVLDALGAYGPWTAAIRGPVVLTAQEQSHPKGLTPAQSTDLLVLICEAVSR